MNPGHDGAVAVLDGRRLEYCLESEKDSYVRHKVVTPQTILQAAERIGAVPDIVALGGWQGRIQPAQTAAAVGRRRQNSPGGWYSGIDRLSSRPARFFGKEVTMFTSSHERSHLMTALGMAPADGEAEEAVLIWEGYTGSFALIAQHNQVVRDIPVLTHPGGRYALVYGIAHPHVPDGSGPAADWAGKLMALAAYGDPKAADAEIRRLVDRLLEPDLPLSKREFAGTSLYNAGVESDVCKITAALLTQRMFELFAATAERELPRGLPLRISGGCGLNCDWNTMWRELGHFSSVFVPPCTNDSGSALGTAIDALAHATGDPHIDWDVYRGLEFESDIEPDPAVWRLRPCDPSALAETLGDGRVVAWVEGRCEIGPRALGHRSLLAEPFSARITDTLNGIKKREAYRPIAPICRLEDAAAAFKEDFADPYMLYFRHVRAPNLHAVTHVDGSARAQTVTTASNPALHGLLTAFADRYGIGVLCNTSLNFHGCGFINRLSDLIRFCDDRGIDDFVVERRWYQRAAADGRGGVVAR
jgi:hydroxymethyl cephem carbamoyltransferase